MVDKICRFCTRDDQQELLPIAGHSSINRFCEIVAVKFIEVEERLPQSICSLCDLKVTETVDFYDRIVESDRQLRAKYCLSNENNSLRTDCKKRSTSQDDLVGAIVSNIKTKGNISIAKISVIPQEKLIKREPSPFFCETNSMTRSSVSESADQEENDGESESDDSDYDEKPATRRKTSTSKQSKTTIVDIIEPKYVCARCRGKFATLDNLNEHLDHSITCKDKNVKCDPCDKMFSTRRQYQKHVNGVHRKKVITNICERCKRKFTTPADLEKHSTICTGDFGEERSGILFKCRECFKTFNKKNELMEHIKNHPLTLLCETCGKACETRKQYYQHKSKHLNLKPHNCDSCDKTFATKTLLLGHQHVHTGIKRYVCDMCGKSFAKKSSLTAHNRGHTGETPYQCRECMAKFPTLDRLKNHVKKHLENNCYVYN